MIAPMTRQGDRKCCSMSSCFKRVFDVGTAAFSALASWPFYTSSKPGSSQTEKFLQVCEGGARFLFSLNNFQTAYRKFSDKPPLPVKSVALKDFRQVDTEEASSGQASKSSCNRRTGCKVGIAAAAFIAQTPLVLYSYYKSATGSWIYPLAGGICDAALTIVSLWKERKTIPLDTFQDLREDSKSTEKRKQEFLNQIDEFLARLPQHYRCSSFQKNLEKCFSKDVKSSNHKRADELLKLILSEEREKIVGRSCSPRIFNAAAIGLGGVIAFYLALSYGAVAYAGIKEWKEDQEALAIASGLLNSLANLRILGKICITSATSYYQTASDLLRCRYRRPLAYSVAPYLWTAGRVSILALSWLSFHSISAIMQEHVPDIGNTLSYFAPIASGILLHSALNRVFDASILWIKSCCNPAAKACAHIEEGLAKFRKKFEMAPLEDVEEFLKDLPQTDADLEEVQLAELGADFKVEVFSEGPLPNQVWIGPAPTDQTHLTTSSAASSYGTELYDIDLEDEERFFSVT